MKRKKLPFPWRSLAICAAPFVAFFGIVYFLDLRLKKQADLDECVNGPIPDYVCRMLNR